MRLHTSLRATEVSAALNLAKAKGKITPDVEMVGFSTHRSQTHPHAYDIQLGTYSRDSLPAGYKDQHGKNMRVRRFKNSGTTGAESGDGWYTPSVYSATWHEWGWFIAELFAADPASRWGDKRWGYHSVSDFNDKTDHQFVDQEQGESEHITWSAPALGTRFTENSAHP